MKTSKSTPVSKRSVAIEEVDTARHRLKFCAETLNAVRTAFQNEDWSDVEAMLKGDLESAAATYVILAEDCAAGAQSEREDELA
jgi:hypothetical protein